jgi:hypothetical protein
VQRGVGVRFLSMGPIKAHYDVHIFHPDAENLKNKIGGESVDIIANKKEALSGIFETDNDHHSPFFWTRNHYLSLPIAIVFVMTSIIIF